MKKDNIVVDTHIGTWYVIAERTFPKYNTVYLLEHETYGDDVPCVIIDAEGKLLLEDVCNGFDDFMEQVIEKEGE